MNLFKRKVAVIGSGSWATAIVKILSDNLPSIYWWVREPEVIESVQNNGRNCMYLSSVAIDPKHVKVSNDLVKTVSKADIIIMVIPSAYLHRTISDLEPKHFENKSIISAIKGIVPERMEFITDYLINHFHVDPQQLGVISGPSHAEEIAWRKLTFLTSASLNPELAAEVADYFNCDYVRTNVSDDIFGIECSVVLKNIYALAAGIFRGMGAGDNLLALFNTNCINEMIHLGDFLVTTYSQHSRNRAFGVMIGQGYSIRTAQLEMKMVAEGYYATRCIHEINMKYKINTPIINAVFSILYEKAMFRQEMYNLLKSMK